MASCSSPPKKRPKLSLKFMRKDRPAAADDDDVAQTSSSGRTGHNSAPNGQSNSTSSAAAADLPTAQTSSSRDGQAELVRSPPPPFAGLQNLGNTCYLNSVLQALRFCPGFCQGLCRLASVWERVSTEQGRVKEGGGDNDDRPGGGQEIQFVLNLKKLYDKMSAKEASYLASPSSDASISLSPDEVLETVRDLNPMFQGFLQHDSQELLCCLLSYILDACQNLKKQLVKLRPPSPPACIKDDVVVPTRESCKVSGLEKRSASDKVARGPAKTESPTGTSQVNGRLDVNSSVCDQKDSTVSGNGGGAAGVRNGKKTPQRRSRTTSSDSVVGKTAKSSSEVGKTNGDLVNGFVDHPPGDGSEDAKGCSTKQDISVKKKRLGKFRISANQTTLLTAFAAHKKETIPPNGVRKDLENEISNAQVNGDDTAVNGVSESWEPVDQQQANQSCATKSETESKASCAKASVNGKGCVTLKQTFSKLSVGSGSAESPSVSSETGKKGSPDSWARTMEEELDLIRGLFQGCLLLRTRCNECESYSERREEFQDISLPVRSIPRGTGDEEGAGMPVSPADLSLSWAISEFACVERLTDDNKYFCEHCHHHAEAERSMLFGELPPVLTIHLKRFSAFAGFLTADSTVSKVNDHLATPLSLCLSQWCAKQCKQLHCRYDLCAVVMHSGVSSSSGHYISYVQIPDRDHESPEPTNLQSPGGAESREPSWGKFDDEKVSVLSQQELASSVLHPVSSSGSAATPYLLFYRQVQGSDLN
ncbi:ubiquitin carboxyl-terminal hydrolase 1-like isoform X2 [Patiria miniata]|uniref:Ubiquitin carboxyl-terminal hydrolase n=1 Tax=Patiria miniata TaxID=46514 RepID=A0A914ALZ5_PATMI|nr:ubiquitin carboxyl-terminal hydrolase 1-like isoform X2 [Patiria miniata]